MRPLSVRYRRDIICRRPDCGKFICAEGDVSAALHIDGSPVSTPGFDELAPHVFEVACADGHITALHFPKDIMVVRTPGLESESARPPAVLRP